MRHFSFDQKVLCGIVAFLLILLIGGTILIIEIGRPPLKASESIVEVVTSNEEKLEAVARTLANTYSADTFIGTTEKWGSLDKPYDTIKGTFAEIPLGGDLVTYEAVTDEETIFAANLQGVNSIEILSSNAVLFCKRFEVLPKRFEVLPRGGSVYGEGFFYAENGDYSVIKSYYEMSAPFEPYETGYVSAENDDSYLYVEPIKGNFYYYYLVD